jgi:hypothetical protein
MHSPTYKPTSSIRAPHRVPMWMFVSGDGRRVLSSRPVDVEIIHEGPDEESPSSTVLLSCPRLHVFSAGADYKQAEDDFHDQVVHFYHLYSAADPESLDADAAAIKALYDQYFEASPAL